MPDTSAGRRTQPVRETGQCSATGNPSQGPQLRAQVARPVPGGFALGDRQAAAIALHDQIGGFTLRSTRSSGTVFAPRSDAPLLPALSMLPATSTTIYWLRRSVAEAAADWHRVSAGARAAAHRRRFHRRRAQAGSAFEPPRSTRRSPRAATGTARSSRAA